MNFFSANNFNNLIQRFDKKNKLSTWQTVGHIHFTNFEYTEFIPLNLTWHGFDICELQFINQERESILYFFYRVNNPFGHLKQQKSKIFENGWFVAAEH